MYTIYSRENCRFCENTVKACKTFDKDFDLLKVDEDFTREEFLQMIPSTHATYPAVFFTHPEGNTTFIGGFTEFKDHLTFG